ncbi:tRNA pseudouridine(13) synthase TruD [Enterobacteriaceae bacterium LUAb1]
MLSQTLNWLYGEPDASGVVKASPEDFVVIEDLGYSPDGEGEHVLVYLRKKGCNTRFVADALATFAGIHARDVSFAGMKDRFAVTEQWFCLRIPGKIIPDFQAFKLDGCDILEVVRHQRKVRIGGLQGNTFHLVIRQISRRDSAEDRLQKIAKQGVPNYFGQQRFGHDGHNLTLAERWARGEIRIRERNKRSLVLSAARSAMFNLVTSARLAYQGNLQTLMPGDALQLTGRGSWFIASEDSDQTELQQRIDTHQLSITAPLPGCGQRNATGEAFSFEQQQLAAIQHWTRLLEREKIEAARRAMLVMPRDFVWSWRDDMTLELRFWLPAGSFATSLLREVFIQGKHGDDMIE